MTKLFKMQQRIKFKNRPFTGFVAIDQTDTNYVIVIIDGDEHLGPQVADPNEIEADNEHRKNDH